jgi:phosphoglycerol transferase MdoB-like AlkP superfamily enzyme
VSIISGFPSQPTNSIIKFPQKTQRLPFLSKELEKAGYYAAFYYGGEINFANLNSYFVNGNFSTVVSKRDFDPSEYNSKWGVHDHVVFKRFFDDICKSREPFFKLMFTLSSHEPFDVPMKTAIPGSDEESMFLNSAFYTDKCIGEFIENAKKESWWKNSLVILVSDHGSRLPGNSAPSAINKFRIPMLWLGGALAVKDTVIGCCGSQTDIPHTILNQLEFQHTPFKFSRDLLAGSPNCYALYCFNNGFGFMTPETKIIFDNAARKYIMKSGKNPDNALMEGKAYLQVVEDEFNKYGSR